MSVILTAEAIGNLEPVPDQTRLVKNKEFLIVGNKDNLTTGDGVNEMTYWVFDFRKHEDYRAFDPEALLESAVLTLDLEPRSSAVSTDSVRIQGLDGINVFANLPIGKVSNVEVDLLEYYDPQDILDAVWGLWLPMLYEEDCIVSRAELLLELG